MKDDLISRSALLKSLCNSCDGWCDNTECDCLNCKSDHRCDMVVDIAEAPAVDAEEVFKHLHWVKEALEIARQTVAPVVRCKDCKHMNMTGHFRWCVAWERIQTMGDEGFCNFGERRDDDATD